MAPLSLSLSLSLRSISMRTQHTQKRVLNALKSQRRNLSLVIDIQADSHTNGEAYDRNMQNISQKSHPQKCSFFPFLDCSLSRLPDQLRKKGCTRNSSVNIC
jgi:hypothetical protein